MLPKITKTNALLVPRREWEAAERPGLLRHFAFRYCFAARRILNHAWRVWCGYTNACEWMNSSSAHASNLQPILNCAAPLLRARLSLVPLRIGGALSPRHIAVSFGVRIFPRPPLVVTALAPVCVSRGLDHTATRKLQPRHLDWLIARPPYSSRYHRVRPNLLSEGRCRSRAGGAQEMGVTMVSLFLSAGAETVLRNGSPPRGLRTQRKICDE